MLNVMRDNLRHLKWVLWLVAFSMVAYLGATADCGPSRSGTEADWAARVDGSPIPRDQLSNLARSIDQNYRQMFGDQYTQFAAQMRIGTQAVDQLINRKIILLESQRLGLTAAPKEISQTILEDPSFKDAAGAFIGKERYSQAVSRIGVEAFERRIAEQIIVQKWVALVSSPVQVDDEELFEIYKEQNDRVEVDYLMVATADQDVDTSVSDDDLQAWYESHQEDFRRSAGRRMRYVLVKRSDQLASIAIAEDDIRGYYDANPTDYQRPEQRRARHILIAADPSNTPEEREQARQQAEDLLAQLQTGAATFDALAREHSADEQSAAQGGDLTFFGRGVMVPPFETAVFDTPIGSLAPVVETGFGYHVIEVTDEQAAGTVALEEVRESIERQLRQRRAEEEVERLADELATQITSLESLETIAARDGLTVEERVVREDDRLSDLGVETGFTAELFALETGQVTAAKNVREGRMVAALAEILPSDIAPLDEVRGPAKAAVLNDRALQTAIKRANDTAARHTDLAKMGQALELEVRTSGPFTRTAALAGAGGRSPELTEALFAEGVAVGARGVARVPGGMVIYSVTARDVFDPTRFADERDGLEQQLLQQRQNELVGEILTGLREGYEIEVNDALVERFNNLS